MCSNLNCNSRLSYYKFSQFLSPAIIVLITQAKIWKTHFLQLFQDTLFLLSIMLQKYASKSISLLRSNCSILLSYSSILLIISNTMIIAFKTLICDHLLSFLYVMREIKLPLKQVISIEQEVCKIRNFILTVKLKNCISLSFKAISASTNRNNHVKVEIRLLLKRCEKKSQLC